MAEQREKDGWLYERQPNGQWRRTAPVGGGGTILEDPNAGLERTYKTGQIEAQGRDASNDYRSQNREDRREDRSERSEEFSQGNARFDNISSMRKEFNASPSVAQFKLILPQVATAMKLATNPNATGADDLNIIYTFGKVMDPGSVVREAELAMAQGTGSWAQSLEAAVSRIKSGERLPPEVRRNLVESMRQRGVELGRSYQQTREEFTDLAKINRFNPQEVVGRHAAMPFQQAEADFTGKPVYDADGIAVLPAGMKPKSGQDRSSGLPTDGASGAPRENMEIATGKTRDAVDPQASALIDQMIRKGASAAEINAAITPMGFGNVTDASVSKAQNYLRTNPNYRGGFGRAVKSEQLTAAQQVLGNAILNPVGAGAATYLNAAGAGLPTLLGGEQARMGLDMARANSPKSAFAGDVAGSLTGFGLTSAGLRGASRVAPEAAQSLLTAPLAAEMLYGTALGANTAGEGNRLQGAALGATATLAGNAAGRYAIAPALRAGAQTGPGQALGRALAAMSDRAPYAQVPPRPTAGARSLADAIGPRPQALAQMQEANSLGLPMLPADLNPATQALAGAVTRRSPNALNQASEILRNRGRGQIDRLQSGLERDFGPGANIPQRSNEMMQQARAAAAPLYDAAYAAPPVSSPELDSILGTPFGRQAVNRAQGIAANERRDPRALGFVTDADGNITLDPSLTLGDDGAMIARPAQQRGFTPQTLDYVKRGMDDVIESNRDPVTGRLNLDEAGRAQNQVRQQFLGEVDRTNPDYAAARAAFAGPAQAQEVFRRGTQAFGKTPDVIDNATQGLSDDMLAQYRLGYRSTMGDAADKVRYAANPYETVAGSPAQRESTAQLFPDNADRFFRQADLERELAQSSANMIGGSQTAPRAQADKAFEVGPGVAAGVDLAASAMTGAPPITSMLAAGGTYIRDVAKLGIGRRAERRAEEMAPILFNPDYAAAQAALDELLRADRVYNSLNSQAVQQSRRVGGMFGRGASAPITAYGASYLDR